MSVCYACNKILTEKEEVVSYDYCRECLVAISSDIREWEEEYLHRGDHDKA